MLNKYIVIPISDLISRIIIKRIRNLFTYEPQEFVEITERDLWGLLKEYQKETNIEAEDFVKLGSFTKYLLIKLNLIKYDQIISPRRNSI